MSATSSTAPAAGTVVDGRYQLDVLLGEGTFGGVWRAHDTRLAGRPVAVKFLKSEYLEHAGAIARFEAEGAALAQIPHPNIVAVLDRGVWNHQRFLVMELVDGEALAALVQRHRDAGTFVDVPSALSLFDPLCAGLEAAHAVRSPGPIVHRDLKPDNILVRQLPAGDFAVKVLDFGIAQLGRRSGTQSGALMGTPLYMAPEQAMGQVGSIGPWTDVFALGVILAELLTTRQQASADEPWWGTALQRPKDIRATLERQRPDVPAAVWDVVARCLRPQGSDRYPDAGALRAALRQAAVTAYGAAPLSILPWTSAPASTPPAKPAPTPARVAAAYTPTMASQPEAVARTRPDAPAGELSWGKLLGLVAAGAALLALAIVALLVTLDGRARGGADATPRAATTTRRRQPAEPVDAAAVGAFLERWSRARRAEAGADALERLYATSLKYHGSGRAPDFAAMTRDLTRQRELGGSFDLDLARTERSDEPDTAEAVPDECRRVPGAAGPVVKLRAWARELRTDRTPDVGCPRLEGRYLLRLRQTPAGLRVCHETWSVDEGICASCPGAPLCQRRRR